MSLSTIHPIHSRHSSHAAHEHAVHDMAPSITIKVVENEDERFKAMLVRAIVYMHEQQCPFSEEFDLNDHTATQIVGITPEGEPVLTARVRYFNGFAKIERLSIRSQYRGKGYAHRLLRFILALCRQKGFSLFYLHAQARLADFYQQYGFRVVGAHFTFSDHDYLEMVLHDHAEQQQPSYCIGTAPMLLNRPENSPGNAGPLERNGHAEEGGWRQAMMAKV
ncbi:GNAT family N-acetyltransferase [Herbaspirillum rubrisubalbicans]|uniref:GNAT family N-acetyltransferase n=1 Tax=Herbaspirillum rubrisubalbicans TaxID=80842 RepID=UPI00209F9EB4|nr:GNAT family N-acetyltransferase [Herbaspirillum rubrisubalbicans]MCP1572538.1 putative GNAT family N-acyltransferase [Herbaspirillum rubrisubalbicans]